MREGSQDHVLCLRFFLYRSKYICISLFRSVDVFAVSWVLLGSTKLVWDVTLESRLPRLLA